MEIRGGELGSSLCPGLSTDEERGVKEHAFSFHVEYERPALELPPQGPVIIITLHSQALRWVFFTYQNNENIDDKVLTRSRIDPR